MEHKFIGRKIGSVRVLKEYGIKRQHKTYWCLCSCGKESEINYDQLVKNKNVCCPDCKKHPTFTDLSGKRFGRWTVIGRDGYQKKKTIKWKCVCDCGVQRSIVAARIKNGTSKSCGCLRQELSRKIKVNLVGQKFGRLIVISKGSENARWICKCACGSIVETRSTSLYSGATQSCGCIRREKVSGSNSRFWKGGITQIIRGIKASHRYCAWVRSVKKRDNYVCQNCGITNISQELHAHHILNFCDNIDKGFDVDNGITLCKSCHRKFHKMFGKRNTNEQQLQQFKSYAT